MIGGGLSNIHIASRAAATEYDRINKGGSKLPISNHVQTAQKYEFALWIRKNKIDLVLAKGGKVSLDEVSPGLSDAQYTLGINACKQVISTLSGDSSKEGEPVRQETARLAHSLALAYRDLLSLTGLNEDTKKMFSRYTSQIEQTNSFRSVSYITSQVQALAYSNNLLPPNE